MTINVRDLVFSELQKIRASKGLPEELFQIEEVLLGEDIGIDSLDLATLIVNLEEATGIQPFQNGFVMFETIGELINLFSA